MTAVLLETDRLTLRPATRKDASAMADLVTRNRDFFGQWEADRKPSYYSPGGQTMYMLRAEQGWESGRSNLFLIEHKADGGLLGNIHFINISGDPFQSCRLSYKIDQAAANKGYMSEALATAMQYIFEVRGLQRVVANVMERNTPSMRLLQRLDFEREGVARRFMKVRGAWEDHVRMVQINEL